jgi:hypothetical protein
MSDPVLVPVLAGERCIGTLLARGPQGWEAFNRDDQSLGVYPTTDEAVAALIAAASEPSGAVS